MQKKLYLTPCSLVHVGHRSKYATTKFLLHWNATQPGSILRKNISLTIKETLKKSLEELFPKDKIDLIQKIADSLDRTQLKRFSIILDLDLTDYEPLIRKIINNRLSTFLLNDHTRVERF